MFEKIFSHIRVSPIIHLVNSTKEYSIKWKTFYRPLFYHRTSPAKHIRIFTIRGNVYWRCSSSELILLSSEWVDTEIIYQWKAVYLLATTATHYTSMQSFNVCAQFSFKFASLIAATIQRTEITYCEQHFNWNEANLQENLKNEQKMFYRNVFLMILQLICIIKHWSSELTTLYLWQNIYVYKYEFSQNLWIQSG